MAVEGGGDVRGFYRALGVELADWAQRNAPTRCFSNPDAHTHGDRNPSTSVSLASGAWNCWGCGARGGAYDAALTRGRDPREAIDLMVTFGLIERRSSGRGPRRAPPRRSRRAASTVNAHTSVLASVPPPLEVSEDDVRRWTQALLDDRGLLARLAWTRLWSEQAIESLQVGLDRGRIIFPVRDQHDRLTEIVRYAPPWSRADAPKVLTAPGSRHGLFPAPERLPDGAVFLLEGQPDALTAASRGYIATAITGVHGWREDWAPRFAGRLVMVCLDCDVEGRHAARRVFEDLRGAGVDAVALDLAPERDDGYDLTDFLLEHHRNHTGT